MNVLWYDDQASQDPSLVGGKAANLSRLSQSARVPPAFCLTMSAFLAWQAQMDDSALPLNLYDELSAAYEELGRRTGIAQPAVAVRSSALGEDSRFASFAGQYETRLNVRGVAALAAAVIHCWQAATSNRLQHYQAEMGVEERTQPLALIVQLMVDAESAAVAFSANPVTGAGDEIVVNAVWGLGDTLVGGVVTPDSYVVQKANLTVQSRTIVHKTQMSTLATLGVTLSPVPALKQAQSSLSDDQVIALAMLALRLEQQLGEAVDVECAWQSDTLYLLQCRPITTLRENDKPLAPRENGQPAGMTLPAGQHDEDRQSHAPGAAVGWDRPDDANATWMGGRQPVKPLQQSLALYYYQGWAKAFRAVGAKGGLRARFVNGYEYRCWQFSPLASWEAVENAQRESAQTLPQRWANEWLPEIQVDLARWRQVNLSALADDELACHLHDLLNRQLRHWEIHAILGSAPLDAVQRLVDWYLGRFPDAPESEPYRLVQGQVNVSLQANHQLWQLSNEVNYASAEALRQEQWEQLPAPFQRAFADFVERYTDGLAESRRQAAQILLRYAEYAVPDPLVEIKRLAAERAEFTAAVRARLNEEEMQHFEKLLELALAHNPLTEDHNLYLDQQSDGATRRLCAEFGRRLAAADILDVPEESEFLSLYELIQWGFGLAQPLRPLVAQRKRDYAAAQEWHAPAYLGRPPVPATWVDRFGGPALPLDAEEGTLRGVGASAGLVAGRARVAKSLAEALHLQPDEILVCPLTDPRWTPLFALAAGLVTDHGGSLAHAAVLAREYRLPAVVGTHTATQRIHTGQWIEIDGLAGVVRVA